MASNITNFVMSNLNILSDTEVMALIAELSTALRDRIEAEIASDEESDAEECDEPCPETVLRAGGQDIFFKDITENIVDNVMSDEEYEIYARFVRSYQEDSDAEEEEEGVEEDENHDHDEEDDDSDEDYNPEDENAENDETDNEEGETDTEEETDDELETDNEEETDDIDDYNIRNAIINGWVVCRQRS